MKYNYSILLVEDNDLLRATTSRLLRKYGEVSSVSNFVEAESYLQRVSPDIAFLDLNLCGNKMGDELLPQCVKGGVYPVILSSFDDEKTIAKCLSKGAQDYFVKSSGESLLSVIDEIFQKFFEYKKIQTDCIEDIIVTHNESYRRNLKFLLQNVKMVDYPISISGETGTGKTILAEKIHQFSGVPGNFVCLNCSSIPSSVFESEMFGHAAGAFTGANKMAQGKLKLADNGTLFLDEIDSLSLDFQVKLLKALEEKKFYPVGADQYQTSNFRLICASQNSLADKVKKNEFRDDLYYRICCLSIAIPPLRYRKEDIPMYLKGMLQGRRATIIEEDGIELLKSHPWHGNLRELKILAMNLKLLKKNSVKASDIKELLVNGQKEDIISQGLLNLYAAHGFKRTIEIVQRELALYVLKKNHNKKLKTIAEINISKGLFYKLISDGHHENEIDNEI